MVTGPHEPPDGRTDAGPAQMHWSFLAGTLGERGIVVSADDLQSLLMRLRSAISSWPASPAEHSLPFRGTSESDL